MAGTVSNERTGTPLAPLVFISYASVDRERVLRVVEELRGAGLGVWMDQSDIPGGAQYGTEISDGIQRATALVLMCSRASLASRNVKQEIQIAWKYGRPYVPLLLEPVEFPDELEYQLEGWQWVEVLGQPPDLWLPQVMHALARLGFEAVAEGAPTR